MAVTVLGKMLRIGRPERKMPRVSAPSVIGCVGSLVVATRGSAGPGEVLVSVGGAREAYLAWSDEPLPKDTMVLVIDERETRTVDVTPWTALDL